LQILLTTIGNLILPLILFIFSLGLSKNRSLIETGYIPGCKDGLKSCINLLPTLVLLVTAVEMFNESGAAGEISSYISPYLCKLGIPAEITPFIIVRPISGAASTSLLNSIFYEFGPDSFIGFAASIISGSSDTVVYIVTLYYSYVGIKKSALTFFISFSAMIFGIIVPCILTRLIYR